MDSMSNAISKHLYNYRCNHPIGGKPMPVYELANVIGVNRHVLADWLTGKYLPSLKSSSKIAKVLGITLDELIGFQS